MFCAQSCETLEVAETVAPLTFEGFLMLNSPLLLLRAMDTSDCIYQNTLYSNFTGGFKARGQSCRFPLCCVQRLQPTGLCWFVCCCFLFFVFYQKIN